MSKLTALRKQISRLEAAYAREAKVEIEAAVQKVRGFMSSLGVTLEQLGASAFSKSIPKKAAKKAPAKKRAGASVPKYMDPKTGATWSGFGRAPGWISGSKNRDVFLVNKPSAAAVPVTEAKAPVKKVKAPKVKTSAKVATPRAAKNATPAETAAPAKKATTKVVAAKKPAAKKSAAIEVAVKKPAAKKVAKKKAPVSKAAEPTSTPSAATAPAA